MIGLLLWRRRYLGQFNTKVLDVRSYVQNLQNVIMEVEKRRFVTAYSYNEKS